jgi:hypothetical protein
MSKKVPIGPPDPDHQHDPGWDGDYHWCSDSDVCIPSFRGETAAEGRGSRTVTGCVNRRIDGEACAGEDKGAIEAPGFV